MRRSLLTMLIAGTAFVAGVQSVDAAGQGQPTDWSRFYNYPYVYYPHNYQAPQEYNDMYHRYPQSRQIPVYNKDWYNFYPSKRPYHMGHHYTLDVF
ncbi:MAG: hypothetical protein NTW75_09245 [Planctomycetales bacterium]|jgi:hypothetical protein|nr:hypothetical protein [Planctomycetales bacterium]